MKQGSSAAQALQGDEPAAFQRGPLQLGIGFLPGAPQAQAAHWATGGHPIPMDMRCCRCRVRRQRRRLEY